jgi:hypothetical protein
MRHAFLLLTVFLRPDKLVVIDGSGVTTSMTRTYARDPRGERVHGSTPRNRGTVTTLFGALGLKGRRAIMTIEGGTSAAVFEALVQDVLVPALKPGDVVVLDNLGATRPSLSPWTSSPRAIAPAGSGTAAMP